MHRPLPEFESHLVSQTVGAFQSVESVTWFVQRQLVRLSEQDIKRLGLDIVLAVDLAATSGA